MEFLIPTIDGQNLKSSQKQKQYRGRGETVGPSRVRRENQEDFLLKQLVRLDDLDSVVRCK